MADFTGYDTEEVKQLVKTIKKGADDAAKAIVENLKTGIITPMSKAWYTPDGVKYWKAFAADVKKAEASVKKAFNEFIKNVENTEKGWAEGVGAASIGLNENVDDIDMTLNVDDIKESDGTKMGINETEATRIANSLSTVEETINTQLKAIGEKLKADQAFIGRGQGDAITACFKKVMDAVAKIFDFLTEGDNDNNVKAQINAAVKQYGENIGAKVASSYNNAGIQ